ncbi:DsbA family protein [Geodermatophilus nigrescens]|uniref:Protein-disulfide isomerase n=1 Tax=Geodermatophilus nigrescens TaxID=1070870 RepID=A0A1M5EYW6_9ACTN|nr:thioredoxin domain-containing protein [Geodermatophilus nigrescens]SHF84191.1 Protein-disulfide isomerase [Geodermatophilus nigrescens]
MSDPRRTSARRRIAERRAAEAAARAAALRRRRTVVGGVVAAVLVLVAVVVVVVVQTQRTQTSPAAAVPAGTTDGGTAVALGPDDAPVTVDVYEDPLCPYCARIEAAAGDTLEQLAADGAVQVRYRTIAFLDRASTDDYSTRALNAAGVVVDAAGVEAWLRFHDALFAEQPAEGGPGLDDDRLVELAAQAGATGAEVERGIRDLRFADWTEQVTDAASRAGVTGTPTVLVDGEPLPAEELTAEGVRAAVEGAAP